MESEYTRVLFCQVDGPESRLVYSLVTPDDLQPFAREKIVFYFAKPMLLLSPVVPADGPRSSYGGSCPPKLPHRDP